MTSKTGPSLKSPIKIVVFKEFECTVTNKSRAIHFINYNSLKTPLNRVNIVRRVQMSVCGSILGRENLIERS